MVRSPCVAGEFYEADFEKLNKQIENIYYSKKGPGDLPVKRGERKIRAVIVPHAGYPFSGPCAAWAYKEIAESRFPKTFVLLGPNHFGTKSGISIEDWKTPFGIVKTDKDLVMELKDKTDLRISEEIHVPEHSLEVQLPMLQYACRDRMQDVRIVPIMIGRDWDYRELSKQLFDVLKEKDVVFVISSDFTHYGPSYHYLPFTLDIPERLNELDRGAINLICAIDSSGFAQYVNSTGITICGYMPILVYLAMLEKYETKPRTELLMHYTSGDLFGEYKNSVSYASILFK